MYFHLDWTPEDRRWETTGKKAKCINQNKWKVIALSHGSDTGTETDSHSQNKNTKSPADKTVLMKLSYSWRLPTPLLHLLKLKETLWPRRWSFTPWFDLWPATLLRSKPCALNVNVFSGVMLNTKRRGAGARQDVSVCCWRSLKWQLLALERIANVDIEFLLALFHRNRSNDGVSSTCEPVQNQLLLH